MFSNMNTDNLLVAASRLFYPSTREEAVAKLLELGVLTDETVGVTRRELEKGVYSYRTLFRTLGPIKVDLDLWTRQHEFNQFRPTYAQNSLARYARAEPDVLTPSWLANKDVMDFGAGDSNPLSVSVMLYVNGARSVTAFEPGGWRLEYARTALRELIAEAMFNPAVLALPGADPARVKARLVDIDFSRLVEGDDLDFGPIRLVKRWRWGEHPPSFDLILSTSVLEHVRSFEAEISHHLGALRTGGVSINLVDFTDHRHAKPEFSPFGFYADGVTFGCNLLRVCDLEKAAEIVVSKTTGAGYEIKCRQLAGPPDVEKFALLDRFKAYDMESLRTRGATLVLRR